MVKQIIFRVPDELKDVGDAVFTFTGNNVQDVMYSSYTDFVYRTIGFIPGHETLVKTAYLFMKQENEKVLQNIERKYFEALSSNEHELSHDSKKSQNAQNDLEPESVISHDSNSHHWEEIDAIVKNVLECGDREMMKYIFRKIRKDNFRKDMEAVENEIAACIPFEIDESVLYDVLCEVRCLLSKSPPSPSFSLI